MIKVIFVVVVSLIVALEASSTTTTPTSTSSSSSSSGSATSGSTTGHPHAPSTLLALFDPVALGRIHPETGKITRLSHSYPTELIAQSLSTLGEDGVFYMIGFNDTSSTANLIGLDIHRDARLKYALTLPFVTEFFVGVGSFVDYNHLTKRVLCTGIMSDGLHHVLDVDPKTGSINDLGSIGDSDLLGGTSTFDFKNNLLVYTFARNVSGNLQPDLLTFDVVTKAVVHHNNKVVMETIDYDRVSGLVYGVGLAEPGGYRTLLSFNARTGEFVLIGKVPGYFILAGSISTIDPINRLLYVLLSPSSDGNSFDLVAIDMHTGNPESHPELCKSISDADCPWALQHAGF